MRYGNTIKHGALEVLAMECLSFAFFGYMDSIFSNSEKLVIMIVCNISGGNRMGVYYLLEIPKLKWKILLWHISGFCC